MVSTIVFTSFASFVQVLSACRFCLGFVSLLDLVCDGFMCVVVVVLCDICYGCDSCVSGSILCL